MLPGLTGWQVLSQASLYAGFFALQLETADDKVCSSLAAGRGYGAGMGQAYTWERKRRSSSFLWAPRQSVCEPWGVASQSK